MSKLNETTTTPITSLGVEIDDATEEKATGNEEGNDGTNTRTLFSAETADKRMTKSENDKQDILRFTMLFNKYNCDLDVKRSSRNDEDEKHKYIMFFNKEVTIHSNVELQTTLKNAEPKKLRDAEKVNPVYSQDSTQALSPRMNRSKTKFCSRLPMAPEFGKPQISEPEMMFSDSLTSSPPEIFERTIENNVENLQKFLRRKNVKAVPDSLVQLNVHPATRTDLRVHNSLTSLSKTNRLGLKGVLKTKIPSLTALDTSGKKSGFSRLGYWDHGEDLIRVQIDKDKKFDLQISRSSNDNNRRSAAKFKKEEAASVSDSKLLVTNSEFKKQIKKNDKKSRGDSLKKERDGGSRKQVQWKTEVDVIYFSTHLAANGDRSGEVIGRVMEPLREEWEQQRKGFYAKMVPSYMESHVKDRFISLLKI